MESKKQIDDKSYVAVRNLTKDFDGLRAVNNLDLEIKKNTVHGIIGPNGSGKTTLVNMISGVLPPTEGDILFKDESIGRMSAYDITKMGVSRTFQLVGLFKNLTVLENVVLGAQCKDKTTIFDVIFNQGKYRRREKEATRKALAALETVGLARNFDVSSTDLAYGEQRLVEIARALAIDPELLILDEPAAGLNPSERAELCGIIEKIAASGITIILIEHHMDIVMNISDVATCLDHGMKLCEGPPRFVQNDEKVREVYLGKGRLMDTKKDNGSN